jgi:hypothetical protein
MSQNIAVIPFKPDLPSFLLIELWNMGNKSLGPINMANAKDFRWH